MRENLYRFAFTLLLAALALVIGRNVIGEQVVQLDVYPKVAVAGVRPVEIRVNWRIARHPDNRQFIFTMNSTNGQYESSIGRLDGDNEQVVFPTCTKENLRPCYRRVTAGMYILQVCVFRFGVKKPYCDSVRIEVR